MIHVLSPLSPLGVGSRETRSTPADVLPEFITFYSNCKTFPVANKVDELCPEPLGLDPRRRIGLCPPMLCPGVLFGMRLVGAGGFEAAGEFVVEGEVDVDFFVAGAVEGTRGGGGHAAGGSDVAGEEDEVGIAILFAGLSGELPGPDVFGVGEDDLDELHELFF